MSSSAALTLSAKSFGSNGIPERVDPSAKATLKKKWQGATFSLSLTDATLKDQGKTLKDLVVGVEKKLADDVKAAASYNLGTKSGEGSLTVDKKVNGSTLTLKATYKQKGDAFVLDETWKFDSKNKLAGSYNFRTEEASVTYTYTDKGWTVAPSYNFQKEAPKLTVSKKQGKNTFEVVYEAKPKLATLTWKNGPVKASVRAVVDQAVKADSASLVLTQEWDL